MKKKIDYNFSNLNKDIIIILLDKRGVTGEFTMLPFLGCKENIKTINFQSKTSEKAIIKIKNKYFFIKKIPWYCADINFLNFVYTNYCNLHDDGFPCPQIIREKNGNVISQIKNDFFIMFDFIDGKEFSNLSLQTFSLGKYLAILHKKHSTKMLYFKHENVLDSVLSLMKISSIKVSKKIENIVNENFKKMKYYDSYVSLVHGDINPSNVIFDSDNNLKALLDFDNFKIDNPIRDIAEAVLSFSAVSYNKNTSNYRNIFNPINENLFISLLNGYRIELKNDIKFFELLEDLPYAINIISAEFYILSFLKKNILEDPFFNYEKLNYPNIDYILKKQII